MKYAIIAISILLIAGILLSGCAGKQASDNSNPEQPLTPATGSNVSQQQLDDLKAGAESLNPEDLGGLTE